MTKTEFVCESCRLRLHTEQYELKYGLPSKTPCPADEKLCRFYQPKDGDKKDIRKPTERDSTRLKRLITIVRNIDGLSDAKEDPQCIIENLNSFMDIRAIARLTVWGRCWKCEKIDGGMHPGVRKDSKPYCRTCRRYIRQRPSLSRLGILRSAHELNEKG
jgi:hypothetical protein